VLNDNWCVNKEAERIISHSPIDVVYPKKS